MEAITRVLRHRPIHTIRSGVSVAKMCTSLLPARRLESTPKMKGACLYRCEGHIRGMQLKGLFQRLR